MSAKQTDRQRSKIGQVWGGVVAIFDWVVWEASLRRCHLCEDLKEVKG